MVCSPFPSTMAARPRIRQRPAPRPHPFALPVRITIEEWDHSSGDDVSKTETSTPLSERVAALDWRGIAAALDANGCAVVNGLVSPETCAALAAGDDVDDALRWRVVRAGRGGGRGEYNSSPSPPPPVVGEPGRAMSPPLAGVANHWNEAMGIDVRYPATLPEYLDRCHRAGQT